MLGYNLKNESNQSSISLKTGLMGLTKLSDELVTYMKFSDGRIDEADTVRPLSSATVIKCLLDSQEVVVLSYARIAIDKTECACP